MLSLPFLLQVWTKKAERIKCPASLPEDPTIPLLTKMLVPVPYQVREKKARKKSKEARSGLHRKGTSDIASEDTEVLSSHEGDENEEEEEESNSPLKGEKKRAAYADLEAEAFKKGKISLPDDSDSDTEVIPERRLRAKTPAEL